MSSGGLFVHKSVCRQRAEQTREQLTEAFCLPLRLTANRSPQQEPHLAADFCAKVLNARQTAQITATLLLFGLHGTRWRKIWLTRATKQMGHHKTIWSEESGAGRAVTSASSDDKTAVKHWKLSSVTHRCMEGNKTCFMLFNRSTSSNVYRLKIKWFLIYV